MDVVRVHVQVSDGSVPESYSEFDERFRTVRVRVRVCFGLELGHVLMFVFAQLWTNQRSKFELGGHYGISL